MRVKPPSLRRRDEIDGVARGRTTSLHHAHEESVSAPARAPAPFVRRSSNSATRSSSLHYITLHYITLHYITLHYIILHYTTQFGHPFILAVRNATKRTILAAFDARLANDPAVERANCIAQVSVG